MRPRHPLLIVSPLALVLVLAGCGGGVLGESGSPAASVPTETSPDASGSPAASPSESAAASGGERPSAPAGEQTTITIQPAEGSDLSGQVILTEYGSWTNVQIQVEGGSSEELWAEIRVGGCTDAAVQPMAVRVPVEDGEATFDIPVPYSSPDA